MSKIKTITTIGIMTALYVTLSATLKIPLIGHIQTDLGYIVFGAALVLFNYYGVLVGVIGCIFSSLVFSGFFPFGWAVGQIVAGIIVAVAVKFSGKRFSTRKQIIITIISAIVGLAVGIIVIKTAIECAMFSIPIEIKLTKDAIAYIADIIPMIAGILAGFKFKNSKKINL